MNYNDFQMVKAYIKDTIYTMVCTEMEPDAFDTMLDDLVSAVTPIFGGNKADIRRFLGNTLINEIKSNPNQVCAEKSYTIYIEGKDNVALAENILNGYCYMTLDCGGQLEAVLDDLVEVNWIENPGDIPAVLDTIIRMGFKGDILVSEEFLLGSCTYPKGICGWRV